MTPIEYAAGWRRDPEDEGLERYWDGSAWTDQVRPMTPRTPGPAEARPPEHVPQLHRALVEATADIDAIEDRLSDLFERTEGRAKRSVDPTPTGAAPAGAAPSVPAAPPDPDDAAFAELDAALAAEEPDGDASAGGRGKRRFFRRRSGADG